MKGRVVVVAPYAPMHAEPRVSSPQISQALGGHVLSVLESRDEWHNVRGADDYAGWVHAGYLAPTSEERRAESVLTSLGCTVRSAGGRRRHLPPGALLLADDILESGTALAHDALRRDFPVSAAAAARTALRIFEGAPYQWGGNTPWGVDCSGLVQTAFYLHGIQLPRDAWQQATTGEDAGRDPLSLAAGDLLFFSDREDRKITHVGIASGDRTMVHSALGRG
ncbi:MAG TPA: SH3 domain-containing C40 family peptidase, partial [Gemmatimonadaceae bacterium]|nr:SH3 domain-containing C40 family peptidase [Gemmatimonadaceae bacterium]